ncbi:sugar kinase [Synechococcus sp. CS-602]|uniref:FGGY-family carbohydrate kinase n=1 Tax=Synechococcus sp. CS-602 TaxID=2847982 RepID=UPI00223A90AA|nr:FGGY-family carbohydrate kinase [Synechococcus sp. CS-602]MCT0205679.1 sugar kinase [Synechococcus sp. CS-602]
MVPAAPSDALALGVDFGSSGLRLALVDGEGLAIGGDERALAYARPFTDPEGWRLGLVALVGSLPRELRCRVGAISLDGTSGTLLLCRPDGSALAEALPYDKACPEQAGRLQALVPEGTSAASASSSLARALRLINQHQGGPFLLRHQADWLMGWLLGHWRWGEEGNNLRLGWDLAGGRWLGTLLDQPWSAALPEVVPSGSRLGSLNPLAATALGLPPSCQVVAGTTDANAAVLAAGLASGDGLTVLGTTLVLKQFVDRPIQAPGVSAHRLDQRWLVGGASNSGGGVLRQFFSDQQLAELSRQIDPSRPSGLQLQPLPGRGERFPVDDPDRQPVLGPRPVSDALFLQGLLEGMAQIEAEGWQRLQALGAPAIGRVITLGGGARNPQWRRLRQQALGVPVINRPGLSSALGSARLACRGLGPEDGGDLLPLPPEP